MCVPCSFSCPCDSADYDCGKRTAVRTPCVCGRLMCRKCAGVVSSMPEAGPCGLCGRESVGPFEARDFRRDLGVAAALLAKMQACSR
jgi:hypothetical protein